CDHEDRPEVIPEMLREARALGGGKIVFAARTQRHDGKLFKAFYGAYKRLYRLLTGMPIAIGNFSVVPGRLLQRLAGVWEIAVHFPAGIMKARLPYAAIGAARGRRAFGQSSMNIVNLVVHGLGGLAVHAEVAAVRVVLGTAAMSAAIVGYLVWVLFEKLFTDLPPLGWTTQVMAVFGGVLLQGSLSALLLLFFAVSMRSQRPVIPFADHAAFIMEVSTLLAAAARDNTALRKPVEAE
ncbi:MAG TPA: glycosyl transferase family 2, partial [Candidatus Omnitrophota bacterium]|nr:glycosyl transferase family 2 [Candidatus Omnitrophota bacterium]